MQEALTLRHLALKYEHALPTTTGGEKVGVVVESSVVSGVEQEQT